MIIMRRMWGRARRVLGIVGPRPEGPAAPVVGPVILSSLTDHGRLFPAAADCTGIDGRPLALILTPGEMAAGLRPGDHRFVGR